MLNNGVKNGFGKKKFRKNGRSILLIMTTQPGTNSTLYKTHKLDIPVRLLTTRVGCNTAIENLSRFIGSICAPLTSNLPNMIKDTSRLLDLIDDINESSLPDNLILVSFDIISMFPNRDNEKGMEAVRLLLVSRCSKNPLTECIMEGLEICLLNNNSRFANKHLLQTNSTATGTPNSSSYSDTAITQLDQIINKNRATQFQECFYFGRYRDDCLFVWCGDFHKVLNTLDEKLKIRWKLEVVVFVFWI